MSDFSSDFDGSQREYDRTPKNEFVNEAGFDDVDLSVLLGFAESQCEDEPDLIVELIDLYLDEFPEHLSAIKDSVSKADDVSLKRAAHTLKGSSANLGVNGVAELCREIEETVSSESLRQSNVINRLEQTLARVRTIFLAERQRRV